MGEIPDKSNGYNRVAGAFLNARQEGGIGAAEVLAWARRELPDTAEILELGCGHGVITQPLVEAGFRVYGVDASPRLVAEFQHRLPGIPVECAAAEESNYFGRQFDAIVSWGLLFLLPAHTQRILISRMAQAVRRPGGRILFTAPEPECKWVDVLSGWESRSLGREEYERLFAASGMKLASTSEDAGNNFYYGFAAAAASRVDTKI
jgi:2-polyprenyl-3-methyl-5-hydroxy-6-metoxy-1,4-benzoquinol methylase